MEELKDKEEGRGEKEREERERVPDEAKKREGGMEEAEISNAMEEIFRLSPFIVKSFV